MGRTVGGAVGFVVLTGLSCLWGDPTGWLSCDELCAQSGQCGSRTWAAGDGVVRCFPRSDADCEQSRDCLEDGLCDYRPERESERCIAAEEASCRSSEGCLAEGRCRADFSGRCRSSDAGCVASRACAEKDRCQANNDRCIVPSGDGPRCESACRVEGACTEVDRRCLATSEAACRESHLCRYAGACTVGPAGTCIATDDADCEASTMCGWNGFCAAREGVCTEGLALCEDQCREVGWCGTRDAVCVPRDDADCAASLACLVSGACGRESPGAREVCRPRSAADCATSLEGQAFGRTELRRSGCAAPSDPPHAFPDNRCFRDPACADEGRCLTGPGGTCHGPEAFGLPPIPVDRRPRVRLPR